MVAAAPVTPALVVDRDDIPVGVLFGAPVDRDDIPVADNPDEDEVAAALADTQMELPPAESTTSGSTTSGSTTSGSTMGTMPHPVNAFFSQFNNAPSGEMPPPVPTDGEEMAEAAPGDGAAPKRRPSQKAVLAAAAARKRQPNGDLCVFTVSYW